MNVYIYDNNGNLKSQKIGLPTQVHKDYRYDEVLECYEYDKGYYIFMNGRIHIYDKSWNAKGVLEEPATGTCLERIMLVSPFKYGINIYSTTGSAPDEIKYSTQIRGKDIVNSFANSHLYDANALFNFENGETFNESGKWSNDNTKLYEIYEGSSDFSSRADGHNIIPSYGGYYMLVYNRFTDELFISKTDENGNYNENWN